MKNLTLFETPFELISAIFVFLVGAFIIIRCSRIFRINDAKGLALYLWHSVLCMVALWYSLGNPSDATRYFIEGDLLVKNVRPGTGAIMLTTGMLKTLGVSYLGCFLFFNIFGSIGLIAIYSSLISSVKTSSKNMILIVNLIVFLPSISFWTSAIGKDAISFLSVGLALWAAINFDKRKTVLLISIFIMLLVRPHMAAIMTISFSVALFLDNKSNLKVKLSLGLLSVIFIAILIPFALNYAGIGGDGSYDTNTVGDYIEQRQVSNMGGGTSINITTMSMPEKIFTYLFRPLPYEAKGLASLVASLDNLFLLILAFSSVRYLVYANILDLNVNRKFMWVYALTSLIILSLTTANLGIAVRQKWMFLPIFIYLFISTFTFERKVKK
jgi:hypothetical protein